MKNYLLSIIALFFIAECKTVEPAPKPQPKPVEILFYRSYEANETLTEYFHKGEALKKANPDKHITGRYIDKYTGDDKFVRGW